MGWFSRTRLPKLINQLLLKWYVWKYQVNLDECVGELKDFRNLSEFFLRELKPGTRPINKDPEKWVSPVDATVHAFGKIKNDRFFQSERKEGSVSGLLGSGEEFCKNSDLFDPERYEGGDFAVLYLSPKDYHRVHTAIEGEVEQLRYLPGRLWPVFPAATRKIDGLFDKNERMVFGFNTPLGKMALVMVGAFGVGRMSTHLIDVLSNKGEPGAEFSFNPPKKLNRAEELGRFELGSTVILLMEKGKMNWNLEVGKPVRLGEAIATLIKN